MLFRISLLFLVWICWYNAILSQAQDLELPVTIGDGLLDADIAKNMCSAINPCPPYQSCVQVDQVGFICKCPLGYVSENCSVECKTNYADIVFLLDSSDSIRDDDWILMLHFVGSAITQLQVDEGYHRIAIITFGNEAHIELKLEDYTTTEPIIERLKNLTHRKEMTNIADSIYRMRSEIFKKPYLSLPIGILITDGSSTMNTDRLVPEAQLTVQAGITMFVIGIGDETRPVELETLSSRPLSKHLYEVDDFMALSHLLNQILETTCDLMPRYVSGATGQTGSSGPDGIPGPHGATGTTGIRGTDGIPGPSGDPGGAGDEGQLGGTGEPGHTGATGPYGPQGSTGQIGVFGPRGDQGDPGYPGRSIDGVWGLPGLKGEPGPRGVGGFEGFPGNIGGSGSPGYPGPVGTPGGEGATGVKGPPGYPGNDGPTGPAGPPGPPGEDGPTGYIYEDSNECLLNISRCEHICRNQRVGYRCECLPGYKLHTDGFSCSELDECEVYNGGCEQHCVNTRGSYLCSCVLGYTISKDDHTCIDVDECCPDQMPINPCPASYKCINTRGSYSCILKERVRQPGLLNNLPVQPAVASSDSSWDLESIFLRGNVIIGIFIWLCVLTVLTIICVILASTLEYTARDATVHLVEEADFPPERALHPVMRSTAPPMQDDQMRIFPRISLNSRRDDAVASQSEIQHTLEPPTVRPGVPL